MGAAKVNCFRYPEWETFKCEWVGLCWQRLFYRAF